MRTLYFCPVVSFCLLFSSPNLSRRRLDVCHNCTHGVALVQIYDAGLKHVHGFRCKYRTQKFVKKSPSGHHHTTLSGYIFATKVHINNRRKRLGSNISSTCSHNMVNLGPLAVEIGPVVWGTPANFNGFRALAGSVIARHSSRGRQPNFAALNRGRHLYSAGRP